MIKTWVSFCVYVGNRALAEGEQGMMFTSVHLVPQASPGPLRSERFPWGTAVGISAHDCLWLIVRMCHSFCFVPAPYFIYLPSPGLLEKHHVVMEIVATTNGSSPNSRCPAVTSSYLGTKHQRMEVIIRKMNIYIDLTPEVSHKKDTLEVSPGTWNLIWRLSLQK